MSPFVHGVEVVEATSGVRPLRTIATGVIGLVGTAHQGPINVPTLISGSLREAQTTFGAAGGTIPTALAGILQQIGARVVVVNANARTTITDTDLSLVAGTVQVIGRDIEDLVVKNRAGDVTYTEGATEDYTFDADTGALTRVATGDIASATAELKVSYTRQDVITPAQIAGGATGAAYTGARALDQAAALGLPAPRILIAPGWSHEKTVADALLGVAARLRAVVVADGPNSTDAAAITYRESFDDRRLYLVEPQVQVLGADGVTRTAEPASARVAGVIARSDAERGYWWSPSNRPIAGIAGTSRPVDYQLGAAAGRAHTLNEKNIATIIRENGWRLWGNRTCADDTKWQFLNVVRIADQVNEAILRGHRWAVDRNITATYLADVVEGVNAYLRDLVTVGAIVGGRCWTDAADNTPEAIAAGKATFVFEFTPVTPAERVTFRSVVTADYLEDLV